MGKLVCVFIMFWGNFVMSLIIVSLASLVDLSREESVAYFQINNELAILKSFDAGADLIKAFFRHMVAKRKGTDVNGTLFAIRMQAKRFRQVSSELMMTAQQVPLDLVINQVYTSVGKRLDTVKEAVVTGEEMEDLFRQAEEGQAHVEALLEQLKSKNSDVLKSLSIAP